MGCNWSAAYPDPIIDYKTWDGSTWSAQVNGGTFRHAPNGDFSRATPPGIIMDYKNSGSEN